MLLACVTTTNASPSSLMEGGRAYAKCVVRGVFAATLGPR